MLKRIFLGLLLAVVLLVAAVAVKTWTTPSQQLAVAPAPKLDIDVQAAGFARTLGVELHRTASLNTSPTFIRALADVARRALA
jgi:carboxypeptidase PM20D1